MLRRKLYAAGLSGLLVMAACAARKPGSPLKPGFNLFSKEQDIQVGQEAAQQVRQQYPVVQNSELQDYIKRLGQKLASAPSAARSEFPFSFTLLNQDEVNAFALPGGPTFVFSGLIGQADNEAQLAGVLAHEISHVVLRHGTNQVSKANLLQIPAAIAGAALGQGAMSQVVQLGLGVGLNGLFLKYSRDDESQADALGTHIMSEAGYNPIEMARFFEKLEAKGGPGVPQFLSDHPNPGNRIKAVEAEIRTLPQRQYAGDSGEFPRAKRLVAQLPAAPKPRRQQAALNSPNTDGAPAGFRQLDASRFSVEYPDNWQAFGDQNSSAITIAPRQGLVQGANGGVSVGYGAMMSYYFPENSREDLRQSTEALIHHLHAENPSLRAASGQRRTRVGGSQGLVTNLTSESPFGGAERDVLLTVSRPEGLFYLVFAAPEQNFGQAEAIFNRMLSSLRFK